MALFVDVATGFPLDVEVNIAEGVGPDAGNVSDTPVPGDSTAVRIVFTPTTSGFGQDRLDALVNTLANFIVVTGVNSSFIINGGPISNNAGVTFVDGGIIRVVYDVTQCGGSNYFVFDSGNNQIGFPSFVLLGHELAHAFHLAVGDSPPPGAAAEFQAITDENGYRTQFGLTLRDPNNHAGGCGFTPTGPGPTISCLIASAACGTPEAPQLNHLRRLRDIVLRGSAWGAELFAKLHQEYYRFSPQVAAQMNRTSEVRRAISALAVEPFFEFLSLLEAYARLGTDVTETVETRLQQFSANLPKGGVEREHAAAIERALSNLKTRLCSEIAEETGETPVFAPRNGAGALEILECLCAVIEAAVPARGYVEWALLDPLILFWRAVARPDRSGSLFLREVDDWLGSTPVPSCYRDLDEQSLEKDLVYLRGIWFTSRQVRAAIAQRLLESAEGWASSGRLARRFAWLNNWKS
jgi:hypothetical protein